MGISRDKAIIKRNRAIQNLRQDYIGKRYGYIVLTEFLCYRNQSFAVFKGKCDCGIEKEFYLTNLKSGITKSCGCHKSDTTIERSLTHGLSKNPIYHIWTGIKTRCYNKADHSFKDYGAKGIIMCEEWYNNFKSFFNWCIENNWQKGLHIDRFPNNLGIYEPNNCRIVTSKQNANNKPNNRILNINGEEFTVAEVSEKYNVNYNMLLKRIKNGWDVNKAIQTPSQKKPKSSFSI